MNSITRRERAEGIARETKRPGVNAVSYRQVEEYAVKRRVHGFEFLQLPS